MKFIDFTQIFDPTCNNSKHIICRSEAEAQEFWQALTQQMIGATWNNGKDYKTEGTHFEEAAKNNTEHAIAYSIDSSGLRVTYNSSGEWPNRINFDELPVYEFEPKEIQNLVGKAIALTARNYREARLIMMMFHTSGLRWYSDTAKWSNTLWRNHCESTVYYLDIHNNIIYGNSDRLLDNEWAFVSPYEYLTETNHNLTTVDWKVFEDSNTVVQLTDEKLSKELFKAMRTYKDFRLNRTPEDLTSGKFAIRAAKSTKGVYYVTYGETVNYIHKGRTVVDIKTVVTVTEVKPFPMDKPKQDIKQLVEEYQVKAGAKYRAKLALKTETPQSCIIMINDIASDFSDMSIMVVDEEEYFNVSELSNFQLTRAIS